MTDDEVLPSTRAAWALEVTERAQRHWTDERLADLMRGKSLPLSPRDAAPLLRALGLLHRDASMPKAQVRKYLQINHMIAVLGPSLKELCAEHERLDLVDAACGRSYLTLALAWHLSHNERRAVRILGVDRNEALLDALRRRILAAGLDDVVRCEAAPLDALDVHAAWSRAFGDVEAPTIHGLVSLHACDTATCDALALGVSLGATLVAAAPCCQAELARQWAALANDGSSGAFAPIHRVPHLRRETAATLTDTLRALLLRGAGYECWPLMFVPSEHTPKNTLLRAMRRDRPDPHALDEYVALVRATGGAEITLASRLPTIERALREARAR